MLYRYGKFLQEQGEQKSWKLRIGKQLPALAAAQGNLLWGIDNYLGVAFKGAKQILVTSFNNKF